MTPLVVMMHKDEKDLIDLWIDYYSHVFGPQNLVIIDNGSTAPICLAALVRAEQLGATVLSFPERHHFEEKGLLVERVFNLRRNTHDVFLAIDCDEFIGVSNDQGYSCDKQAILDVLGDLPAGNAWKVAERLVNHPWDPRVFHTRTLRGRKAMRKLLFTTGDVQGMDVGFHRCAAPAVRSTAGVVYFEFHNKPFSILQEHARAKLALRVRTDDMSILKSYRGLGEHLAGYLVQEADDYYAAIANAPRVATSAVDEALQLLGRQHPFAPYYDQAARVRWSR